MNQTAPQKTPLTSNPTDVVSLLPILQKIFEYRLESATILPLNDLAFISSHIFPVLQIMHLLINLARPPSNWFEDKGNLKRHTNWNAEFLRFSNNWIKTDQLDASPN